jgi:TPR repeat protein
MAASRIPVAMEQVGMLLIEGKLELGSEDDGAEWLRRSAAAENPVAMHLLAEHLLATNISTRTSRAQALLESATDAKYLRAQVALGSLLLDGSLPPNASRAIELLRDAAARGSRLAHIVLAASFVAGIGVSADRDGGVGWLRRLGAITPRKIGALGSFLYAKALTSLPFERRRLTRYVAVMFQESIRRGNADDEVNLAYLVRRGEVPQGEFASLDDLLGRHLAAGAPHALINQALRLARGLGHAMDWKAADALVAQVRDFDALLGWYQPRATAGDAEGHLVIGWLVRHGLNLDPSDLPLAARFEAARSNGWAVPDWLESKST